MRRSNSGVKGSVIKLGAPALALLVCLWMVGCDAPSPLPPTTQEEIQKAHESLDDHPPPEEPEELPRPLLGDPIGSVRKTLRALAEGDLPQAYDFLPPSYQREIDELVHTVAGKFDAETWTAAFTVLRKTAEVLKTKKDWVLPLVHNWGRSAAEVPSEPDAMLAENWDALVQVLELIARSELSEHQKMQEFSARGFLKSTGRELFEVIRAADEAGTQRLRELPETTVELVSHKGNSAILRLRRPQDPAPTETPFVYREGRWIQQSLAENWPKVMGQLHEQLAPWTPERLAQIQPQLAGQLRTIEQTLEKMLAAERAEDFQALVLPFLQQVQTLRDLLSPKAGPPAGVTLLIPYELGDEQQSQLLRRLEQLTDNPEKAEFTMYPGNGRTEIILKPVADVARFAERLTFASKRTVNVPARTIQLELLRD
jgi:hypothetical protein